jgi:hypothetical protein
MCCEERRKSNFQVPIDNEREFTHQDFTITTPKGREKAFDQENHVRWFGLDYKLKLEKHDLKLQKIIMLKDFQKKN